MSRDPVRLLRGAVPKGAGSNARLVRALHASQAATPDYDVDAGLERLTASIGVAAGAVTAAQLSSQASAGGAASAASKLGIAQTVATKVAVGAAKTAFGIKATLSSVLIVGAVAATTVVLTNEARQPSRPEATAAQPSDAVGAAASPSPRGTAGGRREDLEATAPPLASSSASSSEGSATALPANGASLAAEPTDVTAPSAPRPLRSPVPTADVPAAADAPVAAAASSQPGGAPPTSEVPRAPSIQPELDQLAQIRRATDPARALALAEEGHARFPRGLFWQEREAAAITSLARLGRAADARARARGFIERHPDSLYVGELRKIAGDD